jgi:hypothetical protein
MIAEVMLASEGFNEARIMAKKTVTLYSLMVQQLSKQDHYDYGLRNLKAVLNMAGQLKRGDPKGKWRAHAASCAPAAPDGWGAGTACSCGATLTSVGMCAWSLTSWVSPSTTFCARTTTGARPAQPAEGTLSCALARRPFALPLVRQFARQLLQAVACASRALVGRAGRGLTRRRSPARAEAGAHGPEAGEHPAAGVRLRQGARGASASDAPGVAPG